MRISHMLIRSDNVPTDLSSEYKIMEGPEDIIKEICDILNEVEDDSSNPFTHLIENTSTAPYYYSVKEIEEELYDGYREAYGYEEGLTLKEKFDKKKYNITYKGKIYNCDLTGYEARQIYVG